ncbi:rRNA maturation RNase YbeY [bacterium]|nr:rRNA maturation RNase YbeY [bacterium]
MRRRMARAAKAAIAALPAKSWNSVARKRPRLELSVSILSSAQIRKVNRQFRGKDKATDVLSFPAPEVPGSFAAGDLLICPAVAKTQLKDFGTTYPEELERLVVHGVLHLFGYDHETNARDAKRMFALQEKILRSL